MNYVKPEFVTIEQKSNISLAATGLSRLDVCGPGPDGGPNCGAIAPDPTGQLGFCARGISDGTELNECSFIIPGCPSVPFSNCQTEPSGQSACDALGGGLAVSCFITIDCNLHCAESPDGGAITCPNQDPVPCLTVV